MTDEPDDDAGEENAGESYFQQYISDFNHHEFLTKGAWEIEEVSKLLLWGDPTRPIPDEDKYTELLKGKRFPLPQEYDDASPDFKEYAGMVRYVRSMLAQEYLPNRNLAFTPADFMLWAYWNEFELPEAYKESTERHAMRAAKFILDVWMPKEVWPLVDAINLARGFPPKTLSTNSSREECVSLDLYEYLEALFIERGQGNIRNDGTLDVDRDEFLRIAEQEGLWLAPPLQAAAELLQNEHASLESTYQVPSDFDFPLPTKTRTFIPQVRLIAKSYIYSHPDATAEDVYQHVRSVMLDVIGVDPQFFGTMCSPNTVKYRYFRGLIKGPHKPGPKPKQVDRQSPSKKQPPQTKGKTSPKKSLSR